MPGRNQPGDATRQSVAEVRIEVATRRSKVRSTFGGRRSLIALLALLFALSMGVAACGSDDEGGGGGGSGEATTEPAAEASKCGLGNGEKAGGEPIKLGAIVTKQPGVDFTQITGIAQAYFDCVNDNGGINGRPVDYVVKTEQTNPQQVSSLATKLVENDKVLGFVGSTSLLDCPVNQKYYEKKGIYSIVAGVPRECFFTPNFAAINMGPYYSSLGAAQYLVRQKAKSLVVVTGKLPGGDFNNAGVVELAKQEGLKSVSLLEPVPIQDGASLALKLVEAAGDGGGVIIDAVPPEALKIFQGAEQQGLIDKVKWACATPCNDASIADALGAQWNDKVGINAELNLVDSKGPDNQLYQDITKKYAPDIALGSFGQMGFTAARIATQALLDLKGDYTLESVNAAFKGVKGFETDILCKPWYFGDGKQHTPNNTDRTIVPMDGKFVEKEKCFDIAALPGNPLDEIRATEAGN
jgi:branched-chain amino acid transport system substrate-binding protein